MYLYENAIISDINKLFTNNKVTAVIADNLNEGLRRVAAKNEDKITLPAIMLSGGDWNLPDANYYSAMHGSNYKRIDEDIAPRVKSTGVLPLVPSYDMYIIAQSSREVDMLTREIIFHYYLNPTLTIDIPYGIDDIHTFNIIFGNIVRKSQNATGLVYRTINFTLQGAYLWYNKTFNVVREVKTDVRSEYENNV